MSVIDQNVDVSEILRARINGSKYVVSLKSDNKNRISEIVFDKFEHANGFVNELAGNASIAVTIQTCYPINYEANVRLIIRGDMAYLENINLSIRLLPNSLI